MYINHRERVVAIMILLMIGFSATKIHKVKAEEPTLVDVLNTLGFGNIVETSTETFSAGIYNITLYAEFAEYYNSNELSYYAHGTTTYIVVFSGPEGGFGYLSPPLSKIVTIATEFGLSMFTPEQHRYFTENSLNPDGKNHSKVYVNGDDPDMFLIGFENLYGLGDRDYQDLVFSLKPAGSLVKHDVSITNVFTNTPHEYAGRIVNVTVGVKNNGEVAETFNVTAYRDDISVGTQTVETLNVNETLILIFQWNTSGLSPGHNWTMSAQVPLADDINLDDNTLVDGYVYIKMMGDVNADGIVDISDVVLAAISYGSTPKDLTWNPQADIAPFYDLIDIFDLVTITYYYGRNIHSSGAS